ncbi:MAG TPA: DUF4153 domain-containing protein [Pyrinomonadaceae bacterium]
MTVGNGGAAATTMSDRTRLGLGVLEAALLLGLLGDALLRATPWGLNVFLWVGALVAGAHALSRLGGARKLLTGEGGWLWPVALAFASFFVWRDSLTLRVLDALVILGALSVVALGARGGRVRLAGVTDYVAAAFVAGASAVFGVFPLLFADVNWKEIPRAGWSRHALAATRGLLLALPLLLLFGALLMAADAVYEGLVRDTFAFDAELAFSHVFLLIFFSWLAAGYLRALLLAKPPLTSAAAHAAGAALGISTAPNTTTTSGATKTSGASTNDNKAATGAPRTSVTDDAPAGGAGTTATAMPRGGYRFSSGDEEGADARAELKGEQPAAKEMAGGAENKSDKSKTEASKPDDGKADANKADASKADVGQGGESNVPPRPAGGSPYASAPKSAGVGVNPARSMRDVVSLGIVEVGVVLGLLDLLFFSFVAVQLGHFFGDAQHVVTSAGLTFSDYARRGFFELVWVALLALPLLLAAHWLLRKENRAHERVFRVLAGAMVALLFVIMASGLWRMRLYQQAYGQTELRLYTTAFMFWLGAVFVWFALTVLRGRRERFACGALVAWLVCLGALHFVNPDDMIVRTNVAQAHALQRVERFDSEYAVSISADAVPALVELLPEMTARDRAHVAARLTTWLNPAHTGDWRSWNYSRWRARQLVMENEVALREWEARWKAEAKLAEEEKMRAKAQARAVTALGTIPGTRLSIRVERVPLVANQVRWFRRTAVLFSGDAVVSALSLANDDGGPLARLEVFKVSDSLILLRDASGLYAADAERRTFIRSEAGALLGKATYVGAFDFDELKAWRFIPASEVARPPATGAAGGGGRM